MILDARFRASMKQRDYKAEYAKRVAKGLSSGLTRSQARGHPGPGETLKTAAKSLNQYDPQLEAAVKEIRNGKSLSKASKSVGVSAERVRTYLSGQGIAAKIGRRWQVGKDTRKRSIPIYSQGEMRTITVRGYEAARLIGEYFAAVARFLETNDPAYLQPFVGKSVIDASGVRHPFETDMNTLYRLTQADGGDFQRLYRIQM